jgi:GNAT superfamily N-acetyltransferase
MPAPAATRERVARGVVAAWRARVSHLPEHTLAEHDGVVTALSGLPDPELSAALIEREPSDALDALSRAETVFRAHGAALGVDLERGRHASVDRAVEAMGLVRVVSRPAMVLDVSRLASPGSVDGLEVHRVVDERDLPAMAAIEAASFGTAPAVAARMFAPSALGAPEVSLYLATLGAEPVAMAYAHRFEGALGIFGVATMPPHRRRGIGTAVTAFAIRDAAHVELAWLQSSELGVPVYAAMGFESVAEWDVWVRAS